MNFIIVFSVLSVVGDKLIDCYIDNLLSYCSEIKKKKVTAHWTEIEALIFLRGLWDGPFSKHVIF